MAAQAFLCPHKALVRLALGLVSLCLSFPLPWAGPRSEGAWPPGWDLVSNRVSDRGLQPMALYKDGPRGRCGERSWWESSEAGGILRQELES